MLRVVVCHPFPRHLRALMDGVCTATDVAIVAGCLSGAEALTMIRRHDPDAIIADPWLGDMDGIAMARLLACEGRRTRVILISGDLDDAATLRALQHGIHANGDVIASHEGYRKTYPPMNVDD